MTKFPILYKKTSTGKIQSWQINVQDNKIFSESGQVGGKKIQSTDIIKEGKNIGKTNETSPEEQAILEAESKWTAKKKKGYVESIADAEANKTSDLVEGGYLPTLAKVYEKAKKHIKFPCAAQPKLDGIRSTWTGGTKMWSRTRKQMISVPHVAKFLNCQHIFESTDGELYNHEYKNDFEKITKIVNQKKTPAEDHEMVQYHIYDIPSDLPFSERMKEMAFFKETFDGLENCPIVIVETVICNNEQELLDYMDDCLERGYEGAMARNLDAPYENKRSNHLQKLKLFEDAEFEIVGVEEGRGKLAGHAGSFVCQTKEGNCFNAKLKGKISDLKDYFENFHKYDGKMMTVQFQGYTNKNNVPRFPVGLRIREE